MISPFRAAASGRTSWPGTRPSLCSLLLWMASDSFHWLDDGFRHHSPPPGEETLTDVHIRHLRQAMGSRVKVIQFNKTEESRNGADWELWIHNRSQGVGLRIQAKRVSKGGDYGVAHELEQQNAYQCDLLIQHAARVQCLPVYLLYNRSTWVIDKEIAKALCSHTVSDRSHHGCSLISAYHVQNQLFRKVRGHNISHAGLRNASLPWNQVLCDERNPEKAKDPRGVRALTGVLKAVQTLHKAGRAALPAERLYPTPSHARWGDLAAGEMGSPVEEDGEAAHYLMDPELRPLPRRVRTLLQAAPGDAPRPEVPTRGVVLYDVTDSGEAQLPDIGQGCVRWQ